MNTSHLAIKQHAVFNINVNIKLMINYKLITGHNKQHDTGYMTNLHAVV